MTCTTELLSELYLPDNPLGSHLVWNVIQTLGHQLHLRTDTFLPAALLHRTSLTGAKQSNLAAVV